MMVLDDDSGSAPGGEEAASELRDLVQVATDIRNVKADAKSDQRAREGTNDADDDASESTKSDPAFAPGLMSQSDKDQAASKDHAAGENNVKRGQSIEAYHSDQEAIKLDEKKVAGRNQGLNDQAQSEKQAHQAFKSTAADARQPSKEVIEILDDSPVKSDEGQSFVLY